MTFFRDFSLHIADLEETQSWSCVRGYIYTWQFLLFDLCKSNQTKSMVPGCVVPSLFRMFRLPKKK